MEESSKGPLFSNPSNPQLLFSSPSLCPPILPPLPHLSLSRFLASSSAPLPSTFSESLHPEAEDAATFLSHNRLQFLPCPAQNSVFVFFPTGTNLDQIGFLLLSTAADSSELFQVTGSGEGAVFVAAERFYSRILKILVQPIIMSSSSSSTELGYLMLYTLYSMQWYCVVYEGGRPFLRYLGAKQFKSGSIANASWSPHRPLDCLALLDNGDIFLFDLDQKEHSRFRGSKLKVLWEGLRNPSTWLGCEYGARLGTFIVARSDGLFGINRSSGIFSVTSLLQVHSVAMDETQDFVCFAKAGCDQFRFLLASESCIFLYDERSEAPLLKWGHDVERPSFLYVYSLSDLGVTTDKSSTFCAVIGSFWNAESQMFCYGPAVKDPSSLYVWELPHNLLLPPGICLCGNCTNRELRRKESLLKWTDWQKKSVIVLGFGVLNKYLRPVGSSSGFTLIRLTSCGKLEAVKFHACCDPSKSLLVVSGCKSDDVNLLYLPDDNEYDLPKRFQYVKLEYLSAHTKGTLAGLLDSKMQGEASVLHLQKNKSVCICHEKLRGFGIDRTCSTIRRVFNNISSPTSIFDIAMRESWSSLPIELLPLAFSTYSELEDVWVDKKESPLEFLVVPEFPQLPPFLLRESSTTSSKRSKKEQLVGPVLPLPVLLTIHQNFSPGDDLSNRCSQVSKEIHEFTDFGQDLGDGNGDLKREEKPLIAYSPITKKADSERQEEEVTTFVSRVRRCRKGDDGSGTAGLELFDDMSPVEICFEERAGTCNTKAMLGLKTLFSRWQQQSGEYKDFLSQYQQLR